MFGPNWKLCAPLVQEMSSTKLATGVTRVSVRVGTGSKINLKLTRVSAESPSWLNDRRVRPYLKLFTSRFDSVHVCPMAKPVGWFQIEGAGKSGNWGARPTLSFW